MHETYPIRCTLYSILTSGLFCPE